MNYAAMRADGELSKEQYQTLRKQTEAEIKKLHSQMEHITQEQKAAASPYDVAKIKKVLGQAIDVSGSRISDELIEEFVETVMPVENFAYRWKLNFGEAKAVKERADMMNPDSEPILTFTIDFEQAKQFRQRNKLPAQFRIRDWHDLHVEVYL